MVKGLNLIILALGSYRGFIICKRIKGKTEPSLQAVKKSVHIDFFGEERISFSGGREQSSKRVEFSDLMFLKNLEEGITIKCIKYLVMLDLNVRRRRPHISADDVVCSYLEGKGAVEL